MPEFLGYLGIVQICGRPCGGVPILRGTTPEARGPGAAILDAPSDHRLGPTSAMSSSGCEYEGYRESCAGVGYREPENPCETSIFHSVFHRCGKRRSGSGSGMAGGAETGAGVAFGGTSRGREPARFQQPRTVIGRARFLTTREGRPSVEGCRRNGGARFDEAHLSTQSSPPQEDPRIPGQDEHAGGPAGAQSPPGEGATPPDGLRLAARKRGRRCAEAGDGCDPDAGARRADSPAAGLPADSTARHANAGTLHDAYRPPR